MVYPNQSHKYLKVVLGNVRLQSLKAADLSLETGEKALTQETVEEPRRMRKVKQLLLVTSSMGKKAAKSETR
jgi:hypothetical protein